MSVKNCLLIFFLLIYCHLGFGETNAEMAVKDKTKSSLTIEANVYFGAEDEKAYPLEMDFYLIDDDAVTILKEAGFKPEFPDEGSSGSSDNKNRDPTDEDYLGAIAAAFYPDAEGEQDESEVAIVKLLIEKALLKHRAAVISTNFAGTGYSPVPEGNYYLFGIARTEDRTIIWNNPVTIKSGRNVFEADQYNAELVIEN